MTRHILVPTDFSDNAHSALDYALKLYANADCIFYILHSTALHASTMSSFSNSLLKVMTTNATRDLIELQAQIKQSHGNPNHRIEIILSRDDLLVAITSAVNKKNIDTVVMGTKGATASKAFFFGSHTVRVLKKLKECPLLIVPDLYEFVIPKQIAFPTDFNRFFSEKELKPIQNLAQLYHSKLRIVHINVEKELTEIQSYNCSKLEEYLQNIPHTFHWIPDYSTKEIEIKTFVKDLDIAMVAIVNYKHSCMENILKEPLVKKIGYSPIVPFFVIPA